MQQGKSVTGQGQTVHVVQGGQARLVTPAGAAAGQGTGIVVAQLAGAKPGEFLPCVAQRS